MSELNVVSPSSSFVGANKESTVEDLDKANTMNVVKEQNENKALSGEKVQPEEEAQLSPSEVTETLDDMNNFLKEMQRNLSFSQDEQSGESVIIVKDSETDEVIRQIPSEELVVLRKKMDDLTGLLFDTKV